METHRETSRYASNASELACPGAQFFLRGEETFPSVSVDSAIKSSDLYQIFVKSSRISIFPADLSGFLLDKKSSLSFKWWLTLP